MDRVELGIKLEQISRLYDKGEIDEAAKVADTVEWRKVKKWSELSVAEEVYEKAGRLKEARNICVYAYNRNLGGKRLIYKLTELSIQINDLDEADDLYKEFVEEAPKDSSRYILLYKLNVARGASIERLIEILEEYKNHELEEKYAYELACLYAKAGRIDECIRECDDLILWFNEGEYVDRALALKKRFAPLTKSQQAKYDLMEQYKMAGINIHGMKLRKQDMPAEDTKEPEIITEYVSMDTEESKTDTPSEKADDAEDEGYTFSSDSVQTKPVSNNIDEEEILVPEKDYSIYDTQNIQEELAKSMSLIMASMAGEKKASEDELVLKAAGISDSADNVIESLDKTTVVPQPLTKAKTETDIIDEPTKEVRIKSHHLNKNVSPDLEEAPSKPVHNDEEQPAEEEIMEGQIGIMDWLNTVAEESENTSTDDSEFKVITTGETVNIYEAVSEIVATLEGADEEISVTKPDYDSKSEETDSEDSEDDKVINELTKQLMDETAADLAEHKDVVIPDMHPEEEYVSVNGEAEEVNEEPAEEKAEEVTEEPEEEKAEEVTEEPEIEQIPEVQPKPAMNEMSDRELQEVAEAIMAQETAALSETAATITESTEEAEVLEITDEEEELPEMTAEEKKYVRKYLCMTGMEESINRIIQGKKHEADDGTSAYGNIAVMGRTDTDKTGFAINLFKSLHAGGDTKQLKIAKTTSAMLNKKGINACVDKIKGTTLIIENAGMLTMEAVRELTEFMMGQTGSMLIILTGEDYSIKRLFMEAPAFSAMFTYTIELKRLSVNELVTIAKDYAKEKGYSIDEKALLKVYLLIDELQTKSPGVESEEAKKLIDEAISRCGKKSKGLFGRKTNGLTPLKEKHFN